MLKFCNETWICHSISRKHIWFCVVSSKYFHILHASYYYLYSKNCPKTIHKLDFGSMQRVWASDSSIGSMQKAVGMEFQLVYVYVPCIINFLKFSSDFREPV